MRLTACSGASQSIAGLGVPSTAPFPASRAAVMAVLLSQVGAVVLVGSFAEMRRVAAWAVVAAMTYQQAGKRWPTVVVGECHAMRVHVMSGQVENSVPLVIHMASPGPAVLGAAFSYVAPEPPLPLCFSLVLWTPEQRQPLRGGFSFWRERMQGTVHEASASGAAHHHGNGLPGQPGLTCDSCNGVRSAGRHFPAVCQPDGCRLAKPTVTACPVVRQVGVEPGHFIVGGAHGG